MVSLSDNGDLLIGATVLLLCAVCLFLLGYHIGKRTNSRPAGIYFTLAVVSVLAYAGFGTDRLYGACLLPFSGIVVLAESVLPGVALIAGILYAFPFSGIPTPRRRGFGILLLLCAVVQSVRPFVGEAPRTQDVPAEEWAGNVCPQTTESTCSAASAATLLLARGIPASETEMVQRCLTRTEGTLMLGVYRGLCQKTAGTDQTVRVITGGDVETLRQATRSGPVLISVGLEQWQRGRVDPRYESLWDWTPGKRHAIVVFGFLPNNKLDIGDPSVGREQWNVEGLKVLWHGDALQLVSRR